MSGFAIFTASPRKKLLRFCVHPHLGYAACPTKTIITVCFVLVSCCFTSREPSVTSRKCSQLVRLLWTECGSSSAMLGKHGSVLPIVFIHWVRISFTHIPYSRTLQKMKGKVSGLCTVGQKYFLIGGFIVSRAYLCCLGFTEYEPLTVFDSVLPSQFTCSK